jgi:hypothetical protein
MHFDIGDALHEAAIPEVGRVAPMVRPNDDAVPAVAVGGRIHAVRGVLRAGAGTEARFGGIFGAGERTPPPAASPWAFGRGGEAAPRCRAVAGGVGPPAHRTRRVV